MDKFRIWYLTYSTEITWFLIGWIMMCGFHALGKGDYLSALIDFALAYANYFMWSRK